ncbi:nucleotide exchange factor GrpE [bacterium]|nr:nucleotide exchange factor GrpE [bacterium]
MNQQETEKEKENLSIPVEGPEDEAENAEITDRDELERTVGQLQRLQADFINYKKRTDKEAASLTRYVKGRFITALLPVLDDMDLLILHHQEDRQCPVDAVQMIVQKLKKIMSDEGLETVSALGEVFDPEIHEAIAVEETPDPGQEGLIVEEWQKGYRFHDQLLRPSRVKVAKAKAGESNT